MCTVSWVQQPGGYHLMANRDEKRTRGRAFAPAIRECGGVRYVAPIDADFGGTWIAANEFGVSVCLLNGDAGTQDSFPAPQRSRGLLLRELAWETTGADCLLSLRQLDLSPYAPFVLLILEPDRPAILAEWNRERLTVDPAAAQMPLTSSSFDSCGVRRFRLRRIRAPCQHGGTRGSSSSVPISCESWHSGGCHCGCLFSLHASRGCGDRQLQLGRGHARGGSIPVFAFRTVPV